MAYQKKKAITWVMAFPIPENCLCYGRLALSKASETTKPVMRAETPIAVIMK
jgi:hypothetical protein